MSASNCSTRAVMAGSERSAGASVMVSPPIGQSMVLRADGSARRRADGSGVPVDATMRSCCPAIDVVGCDLAQAGAREGAPRAGIPHVNRQLEQSTQGGDVRLDVGAEHVVEKLVVVDPVTGEESSSGLAPQRDAPG